MRIHTHQALDRELTGEPEELGPGRATVTLATTPRMAADEAGLVHGGFVFGLADHAAMLAVNHPHVVLAAAETGFLAPVAVGDRLRATARVTAEEGRRRRVEVVVERLGDAGATPVLTGELTCAVLDRHVLDTTGEGGR